MGSCLSLINGKGLISEDNGLSDPLISSGRQCKRDPGSPSNTEESTSETTDHGGEDWQSSFPTWQSSAETCYQCLTQFTVFNRQHHCRRCRNIFCSACSTRTSKVLLFSIREEVRVCDRCGGELVEENNYILVQKPLLLAGDVFRKRILMGLSSKTVQLRMMSDETSLAYDDESRSEPIILYLASIQKVEIIGEAVGGRSFEICINNKVHTFEAENAAKMKRFVEALRIAIKNATEPCLKERVESERLRRIDLCKRIENNLVASIEKDHKRHERDLLRQKYGLRGSTEG